MTPTILERFFLRRYRRRLLKSLDAPFDPEASHRLDAVDALLDSTAATRIRDLWERVDTADRKTFVPVGS